MRILIMNDDTHEEQYHFEIQQNKTDLEGLLHILAPAHRENYEWQFAYYPDVEEKFAELHSDFDADDVEQCVTNMFDNIMHVENIEPQIYEASFNEIWELAQQC